MAQSVISRNYVVVKYYCCTICEKDRSVQVDAYFYCKTCLKYFCKTCIISHRQHTWLFLKKSPYGKDKIMKWPLSKKMETSLLTCVIHKGEKLTMYCPDHSHLCCSKCIEFNHRLCLQVATLPQAATAKSADLKNMSVRTEKTLSQMKQFQTYLEDRMKSLKDSYNEHERLNVDVMRLNIKWFLLQCEPSTVNTTYEHMPCTIDQMREKIKYLIAEFDKSTIKEKKEEFNLKQAHVKVMGHSCIRLHYELFHLNVAIPKVLGKPELSFIASKKCLEKVQQSDTFLKENFPNHEFTVNGKYVQNMFMPGDSGTCSIKAICALQDGQVLVADSENKRVKLLNQQYQVVSLCGVDASPEDMCQITPSEVAVALGYTREVQVITVTQSQLVLVRKFQLQDRCIGIAHHQGELFICSGTALFKYSFSGKLVCRLYEDISATYNTVWKCAVSPTGDKLFISSYSQHKLLTLARDGTVLATLTDPDLRWPYSLHVTPAGQVLVCGFGSHSIVQVDWEGRRKLATLATRERDVLLNPESVFYSSSTSSILVGQWSSNNILVFRVV